jgi:hypothetical protein
VNKEGDVIRAEFLDKKMRKKVVVARKVVHVHDFGRTPFSFDLFLVTRGGGGYRHLGWLWEKERADKGGEQLIGGILIIIFFSSVDGGTAKGGNEGKGDRLGETK